MAKQKFSFEDSLAQVFQSTFFIDYKGGAALFIGSLLNSLAQMTATYPWAKQALDDFEYFKVMYTESTGHASREFIDSGFERENFSAVFPNRDDWDMRDVKVCRNFLAFAGVVVEISFGIHSVEGPFVSCYTHMEKDAQSSLYMIPDLDSLEGFKDKDLDKMLEHSFTDFAHWLPYATLRYIMISTDAHKEAVTKEKNNVTMFTIATMLTNSYQDFIKKYLVEHVFNGERGITPDNIESEWGVPKRFLELTKFHSSVISGVKNQDNTFHYRFQAIGCTPSGVPDIVFDFRFLFRDDEKNMIKLTGKELEFLEIDNINETLTSITFKAGSLLAEIRDAFLAAYAEHFCGVFYVIYNHYASEVGNEVYLEDNDHAEARDYKRK